MEQNKQELVETKTLLEYVSQYLQGLIERIKLEIDDLNTRKGEKILKKNIKNVFELFDSDYVNAGHYKIQRGDKSKNK